MEQLIQEAAKVYIIIIIAAAVVSWIEVDRQHPLIQFLFKATDPLLKRIRDLIPPINGLDLSPLIALILVKLGASVLVALLRF